RIHLGECAGSSRTAGGAKHASGPFDRSLVAGRGRRQAREPLGGELGRSPLTRRPFAPLVLLLECRSPRIVVRPQASLGTRRVEQEGRGSLGVGGCKEQSDRRAEA